jgi:signal transduction histidine kinase
MKRSSRPLRRAAAKATASSPRPQGSIIQRRAAEAALSKSGKRCVQLLAQSQRLQKRLQRQGRNILSALEEERRRLSHRLQDEIAQALCGVNARLLALKKAAAANPANLKKELAITRVLVAKSVRSVNGLARELDIHQQGKPPGTDGGCGRVGPRR